MVKKAVNISGVSESIGKHIEDDLKQGTPPPKTLLSGKKIGISISESEDIESFGFSQTHLQDAMVEFARYLLVQGSTLLYGGDLRKDGYTMLFSELSFQYRERSEYKKTHFINYSSYPIYLNVTKVQELEFKKNRVEFRKIKPPKSIKSPSKEYFLPDNFDNKLKWVLSLSEMRTEMNNESDARIFMGGKSSKYLGLMPGLLEEAMLSINSNKPTYLIGAFGGITGAIISALQGMAPQEISAPFQFTDTAYSSFIEEARTKKIGDIDYSLITKNLQKYGLKKLSKSNGLSEDENMILFTTPHIPEMIYYVLKGLSKVLNKTK